MSKGLVKKLIILISILIVILIVGIVLINKSDNTIITEISQEQEENKIEQSLQIEEKVVFTQEEKERMYTVEQCVYSYLDFSNVNNSSYFTNNENGDQEKIVNENEKIYNVLSEEYIDKNDITIDNLDKFVQKFEEKMLFVPLDIKYINNDNIYKYAIYGYVADTNYNFIKNIYIIINLDLTNMTFSVEPLNGNYTDIDDIELLESDLMEISKNDDNNVNYAQSNAEIVAKKYMDYYKKLVLSNPEEAYNHLDEEYRDKRFGSLEELEKYINNNRDFLLSLQPQKYLLNSYDEYSEYVCMDKYNNLYIFSEYGPLDYKILLDTYTITTDKFKTEYDSADEQNKVAMNVDKWVQMLNNRDYKTAYSVLDETFRNNNWGSVDAFEQYMREKFPLYYKVEYTTFRDENSTYIQEIVLSDITGGSDTRATVNVIMQLKDNYEFVMSFSTE